MHTSGKYFFFLLCIIFSACESRTKYSKGGFDYPKHVATEDTNFYYYQLKGIEPKERAFYDAYEYLFFRPFDEPNLSIRPQSTETLRLTCGSALGESAIIIVTQDFITIKKGTPAVIYQDDTSRFTPLEKFHLKLLKRNFPFDTAGKDFFVKKRLDSLSKAYPELLDPAYFHKLYDKSFIQISENYNYKRNTIPVNKALFKALMEEIGQSGFWTMPNEIECKDPPMDAGGFSLEANTKERYQIVRLTNCPGNNSKFVRACQRIVQFAKLEKDINLVWNDNPSVTMDTIKLEEITR